MNAPQPSPRLRTTEAAVAAITAELTKRYGNRVVTSSAVREQHGHSLTWIPNQPPDVVVYPQTTEEVAIRTNGIADLYTVLGEERGGAAVVRLHWNPLAPWMWLGALVMAIGGGLSLSDRRLRVGAPDDARAAFRQVLIARLRRSRPVCGVQAAPAASRRRARSSSSVKARRLRASA